MLIKFITNDKGNPAGKLADAELHFDDGPLAGLKLVGFSIWERKNGGRNLTMPARQYSINGERRSFALLRPRTDASSQDALRTIVLDAYAQFERAAADADATPSEPVRVPDFSQHTGEARAAAIEAARTGKPVTMTDGGSMDPDGFRWAPDTAQAPTKLDRFEVGPAPAPVSLPPSPFTLKATDARPF